MTGEELRELRLKLGLKQAELGFIVGTEQTNVSQAELGKKRVPPIWLDKINKYKEENQEWD